MATVCTSSIRRHFVPIYALFRTFQIILSIRAFDRSVRHWRRETSSKDVLLHVAKTRKRERKRERRRKSWTRSPFATSALAALVTGRGFSSESDGLRRKTDSGGGCAWSFEAAVVPPPWTSRGGGTAAEAAGVDSRGGSVTLQPSCVRTRRGVTGIPGGAVGYGLKAGSRGCSRTGRQWRAWRSRRRMYAPVGEGHGNQQPSLVNSWWLHPPGTACVHLVFTFFPGVFFFSNFRAPSSSCFLVGKGIREIICRGPILPDSDREEPNEILLYVELCLVDNPPITTSVCFILCSIIFCF